MNNNLIQALQSNWISLSVSVVIIAGTTVSALIIADSEGEFDRAAFLEDREDPLELQTV